MFAGTTKKNLTAEVSDIYIVDMAELLGTFEQIVLLAVLGLEEEAYGRAVLRAVQSASGDERNISAGAVYATLDRMETKGLLSSRIEGGTPARGGRARRFYRLTPAGASALSEARKTLERMWQGKRWPLEVSA
jgi:PadR family transcriptional regulator, regulatory protein PadR